MSDQNKPKRFNIWKHLSQHKTKGIFGVIGLITVVAGSVGVYLYSRSRNQQNDQKQNDQKQNDQKQNDQEQNNQKGEEKEGEEGEEEEKRVDKAQSVSVPPNSPYGCSKKCFKSSEKCICSHESKQEEE